MATPSQNQSPVNVTQNRVPPYQPPTTSEEVTREQKRISTLLEINTALIQYISQLQTEGHGGQLNQHHQVDPSAGPSKMASQDYIMCMRYMQVNMAWLAASAAYPSMNQRTIAGPALMEHPACMPSLAEKYETLRSLFPGWKGTANAMRPPQQQGAALNAQQNLPPQRAQQPQMVQQKQQDQGQAQEQTYTST